MGNTEYRKALDAAVREMAGLQSDREILDKRIAQLRQTIATLSQLCGVDADNEMGLTDACIEVLRASDKPLTPGEVKKGLLEIGFDLSGYSNPQASIHTTLKRLVSSRRLQQFTGTGGHPVYDVPRAAEGNKRMRSQN